MTEKTALVREALRALIERESAVEALDRTGNGYVDAQLLASTRLTPDAALWTRDKRLLAATAWLGLGFEPSPDPGSQR